MRRGLHWIVSGALAFLGQAACAHAPHDSAVERRAAGFAGYVATYFKSDSNEQVYQSVSSDGYNWKPRPTVLTSTVGTRGARDPVMVTDSARSKFYIIATDLKISSTTWAASTKTGSHSLVMWSSSDMVKWSAPRLLPIEGAGAGMTWAPTVVQEGGAWHFFWTSSHNGNFGQYHSTTKDMSTFSAPQLYNAGNGCMDMDLAKMSNGEYVRALKCGTITVETSSGGLFGKWSKIGSGIGPGEGPAVFIDNKDGGVHLWVDENAGGGYVSYIRSGSNFVRDPKKIPSGMRHGNVMPVTAAEMSRLGGTAAP